MQRAKRAKRVIARGEFTNHCHVITGDVEINEKGEILVNEDSNAAIKHLLEKQWVEEGQEVWTGEHTDIKLKPGTYEFVPQNVYDPLNKRIERAKD